MSMVSLSQYINDQLDRLSELKNDYGHESETVLQLEIDRAKAVSNLVKTSVSIARTHLDIAKHIDELSPSSKNSHPSNEILEVMGFEP